MAPFQCVLGMANGRSQGALSALPKGGRSPGGRDPRPEKGAANEHRHPHGERSDHPRRPGRPRPAEQRHRQRGERNRCDRATDDQGEHADRKAWPRCCGERITRLPPPARRRRAAVPRVDGLIGRGGPVLWRRPGTGPQPRTSSGADRSVCDCGTSSALPCVTGACSTVPRSTATKSASATRNSPSPMRP